MQSGEALAKMLCLEKSMILRQVASASYARTVHSDEANPVGLVEENERKWPQKGDFARRMIFARASGV